MHEEGNLQTKIIYSNRDFNRMTNTKMQPGQLTPWRETKNFKADKASYLEMRKKKSAIRPLRTVLSIEKEWEQCIQSYKENKNQDPRIVQLSK